MAKFVHVNSVMRVNLANLNSSEGGGNQITLKKIDTFNGESFVYVSGQAFRRYLRESIYWLTDGKFVICGIDKNGAPIIKAKQCGEEKVFISEKAIKDKSLKDAGYDEIMSFIIKTVPELDMFGFLLPVSGKGIGHLRKASPFQTTALISSFPYRYNSDMMTRSKAEEQGGDIVKVEIDTFNYLQGAQIINRDMIGAYWDEHNERAASVDGVDVDERFNWLVSAMQNPIGGSKKARMLTDFSPILAVATQQRTGVPYFSNCFEISPPDEEAASFGDVKGKIDLKAFIETFAGCRQYVDRVFFGINENSFINGAEIKRAMQEVEPAKIKICPNARAVFDEIKA